MTTASEPAVAYLATITLVNALDVSSLHDNVMPSVTAIAPGFLFLAQPWSMSASTWPDMETDWLRYATEVLPGIDLDRVRGNKGGNRRHGRVELAEFYYHAVSSPAERQYI